MFLVVSQSVCVLCSRSIVQHSLSSFSDSDRVSGPSDSGSRSSSGDTGEGELRIGSIEIRVQSESYSIRYGDVTCMNV